MRQGFLLPENNFGVLVRAIHQAGNGAQGLAVFAAEGRHRVVTAFQTLHVGRQRRRGLFQLRERLRASDQGLRHRLRDALRLHQRLTGRTHLRSGAVGLRNHPVHRHRQNNERSHQRKRQNALVLGRCARAQHWNGEYVLAGRRRLFRVFDAGCHHGAVERGTRLVRGARRPAHTVLHNGLFAVRRNGLRLFLEQIR